MALSDIDGQKFEHSERLSRAGPGLAGVDLADRKYWNGNWQVRWTSDSGDQQLQAIASDFTLRLTLHPAKPFVTNGVDGISRKGPAQNEFSHYISFTRLSSEGTLARGGKTLALNGNSWMDHEYFNDVQDAGLQGWDWFAIQLDNNEELMVYRLRLKSGAMSPYSSGTFVDSRGQSRHLSAADFTLRPGGFWNSYPLSWQLEVPSESIVLNESTRLQNQELAVSTSVSPTYWEGAVEYTGSAHNKPVKGVGYLELTGYKGSLRLGH